MDKANISNDFGANRMNSTAALRDRAKRLRVQADLLDKLADDTDGVLSEEAELMLWKLAVTDGA